MTVENGGTKFYFRCRSFADIQTGKVLAERRQQKVLLATQDSSLYKNLRSSALHVKAGEIRRSIIAWEEAALNGQVVAGDGTVPAPRVEPIAPNGDITIAEFFEKVFIPAKRGLRDSGKLAAVTFETYQNYWDLFLKKHFNGTRLSATTRRGKGSLPRKSQEGRRDTVREKQEQPGCRRPAKRTSDGSPPSHQPPVTARERVSTWLEQIGRQYHARSGASRH